MSLNLPPIVSPVLLPLSGVLWLACQDAPRITLHHSLSFLIWMLLNAPFTPIVFA